MPLVLLLRRGSQAGISGDERFFTAQARALGLLRSLLETYLHPHGRGRSVLLAGHRGAGKTTLVDLAFDAATTSKTRLLRVPLYAPALFEAPRVQEAAPEPARGASDANALKLEVQIAGLAGTVVSSPAPAEPQLSDVQRLLMELTIALYRALAKETVASFERAEVDPALCAALTLELDQAPSPERLRRFWTLCRRLEHGILFQDKPLGQGDFEVIALASAAQAYRVISGKIDFSEESALKAERSRSSSSETKIDVGALMKACLHLTSGLAVAAGAAFFAVGVAKVAHQPVMVWFGGALAVLIAAMTATRTAKRSSVRKSSHDQTYKFIRDYRIDTLGRELPNLIDRIRRAGLAPVFVIDELDKVDHVEKRLQGLISQLKPLVAEQTFFFFIADRRYYEFLKFKAFGAPYAPEHTYFSERLFVAYLPSEIRRFLTDVTTSMPEEGENASTLEIDRRALVALLMFRSRLHLFELGRLVHDLSVPPQDAAGLLTPGFLRSDAGVLYEITYQIAVEVILDQEDVRVRLAHDNYFRQIAYDALYFLAEVWQSGKETCRLDQASMRKHLRARTTIPSPEDLGESSLDPATDLFELLLPDADVRLLTKCVETLATFLGDPSWLRQQLDDFDDDLSKLVLAKPLITFANGNVAFKFNPFGRSLSDTGRMTIDNEMRLLMASIRTREDALRRFGERVGVAFTLKDYAERFYLLRSSPSWDQIEPTLNKLERVKTRVSQDMLKDMQSIERYAAMLNDRWQLLETAVGLTFELMELADASFEDSLNALVHVCRLARSKDFANALDRVGAAIGLPPTTAQKRGVLESAPPFPGRREGPTTSRQDRRAALWQRSFERFRDAKGADVSLVEITQDDLVCAAAKLSPTALFETTAAELSVADWTRLLLLAREGHSLAHPQHVPPWMFVVAFERLGLARAGCTLQRLGSREDPQQEVMRNLFRSESATPKAVRLLVVVTKPQSVSSATRWRAGANVVSLVLNDSVTPQSMESLLGTLGNPSVFLLLEEGAEDGGYLRRFPDFMRLTWDAKQAAEDRSVFVLGSNDIDDLELPNRGT